MKRIAILAFAAIFAAAFASCSKEDEKETGNTPIVVEPAVADQPDGFANWPRTVYVFDHYNCREIYNFDSGTDMMSKIEFNKGDEVVVIAYENKENLDFGLTEPGQLKLAYKISAKDPTLPIPEIWFGKAHYMNNSLSVLMSPLTASVKVEFSGLDGSFDHASMELPFLYDSWYPSGQTLEASSPVTTIRVSASDNGKTLHFFPMKPAEEDFTPTFSLHYPDMWSSCILTMKRRLAAGDRISIDMDMVTDDNFGGGTFYVVFDDPDVKDTYSHKLSLWDHKNKKPVEYTKTDFHLGSGKNMAFVFGSGGGWNEDDLYSDDFRYWKDLSKIDFYKACGFDFFRIPIDEDGLWHPDGTLRPHGIALLHELVDECIEKGMRVTLDLHWLHISNHFPNEESELHYRNCWRSLHEEFKNYPNEWVAYELINEPTCSGDYWNTFIANSIEMIRDMGETNRVIICPVSHGGDPTGAIGFTLPKGDPNLIMTFHTYYHTYFTFHGAQGDYANYDGPIHYPGRFIRDDEIAVLTDYQKQWLDQWVVIASSDKMDLRREMRVAIDVAEELGVPAFCGEYGCSETCPVEDRIRWFTDKCDLFREYGVSFANWFGFGDYPNDPMPNPGIVKAMTGKDIEGKFYWGPSGVEWHED